MTQPDDTVPAPTDQLELETTRASSTTTTEQVPTPPPAAEMPNQRVTATDRLARWGVKVASAYYSTWGNWFQDLRVFPGALVDPEGYILFETEAEYRACPGLSWGKGKGTVNCTRRIRSLPGYVRCVQAAREQPAPLPIANGERR